MAVPAVVAALLPSLINSAPQLIRIFGSGGEVSERNAKAAETVAEIARTVTAQTTTEGAVRLKLVKPCARCSIPNVDPTSAASSNEPGDTLAGYRADPRVDGGITFGMNAVIVEGIDCTLRVGQTVSATWRFD